MKKTVLLFCFAFTMGPALAQKAPAGSLKHLILKLETDSAASGADIMANVYVQNNPDTCIYYARQLIAYGKKHNDPRIIASGLNIFSYSLYNKGNYPGALDMAFKSLRETENSKYNQVIVYTYNLIGNVYKGQQNYPKALYYYKRCKQLAEALHDRVTLNAAWFNMAFVFKETNVLDSAIYYSKMAVYSSKKFLNGRNMGYIVGTMGDEYFKLKNYKKALEYYQTAYNLDKKNADFRDASINCISLAAFYAKTGKPDSAIYYAHQALSAAYKASYNRSVYQSAELLARLYEAKNRPDSGFKYLKLSSIAKDSLYNAAKSGEVENLTTNEFLRQNEIQAAQTAYQNKLKLYALVFGLLIFLIAALLQWRNTRQRKKAYILLQKQKEEIEAQKGQALIEAALERVRARAMSMHDSSDVGNATGVMFSELDKLGIATLRCGILIIDESKTMELWTAGSTKEGTLVYSSGKLDLTAPSHPLHEGGFNAWKEKKSFYIYELAGEDLLNYFQYITNAPGYTVRTEINKTEKQFCSIFFFKEGGLFTFTSEPFPPETILVLEKFAGVFALTYRRYLDLVQAEGQAREAQIEVALERVRSRTMAMHKSDELKEVIQLVFEQLRQINFNIDVANFTLNYKESDDFNLWLAVPDEQYSTQIHIPHFDHPIFNYFIEAKEKDQDFYAFTCTFEEKNRFFDHLFKYAPEVPKDRKETVYNSPGYAQSTVLMKNISLAIINYSAVPYSEAENVLLRRFANVFEQTYTRFLDLQKAEAQVREAKIEAALERVRSRTMAMFRSDELAETASVLFQQFEALGIAPDRIFIGVFTEGIREMETWATEQGGNQISKRFKVKVDESADFLKMYEGWKAQKKSITIVQQGKELAAYIRFLREVIGVPIIQNPSQKQRVQSIAFFSKGLIGLTTPDVQPPETNSLMERFAGVFDLTYTRFLDLQQAETRAREAKIEAALERVRAAAMAMHDSNDVGNATALVFSELYKLGITTIRCGVIIIEKSTQLMEVWAATSPEEGKVSQGGGKLDMTSHPLWQNLFDAWIQKKSVFTYELTGQGLLDYYNAISNSPGYQAPEINAAYAIPGDRSESRQHCSVFLFSEGGLYTFTLEPFTPETSQVLEKFAAVFSLTYRRYLDLQKAEAQAREAKIEAALERVRAAAMAMHDSKDVGNATSLVFSELYKLGINTIRCGVLIIEESTKLMDVWTATSSKEGKVGQIIGKLDMNFHPLMQNLFVAWQQKKSVFIYELTGPDLLDYYKAISRESGYIIPENDPSYAIPDDISKTRQYCTCFLFAEGSLFTYTWEPFSSEDSRILEKFAAVFSLTYRRYLDLQKAEAQAREAIKQASVDRVRAEIASMRSKNDLEKITPLIWNELTNLGVPFVRCGVFIVDEQHEQIHTYLSTPDGKAIAAFELQFDAEGIAQAVLPGWRNKQSVTVHWNEEEFKRLSHSLVEQGAVESEEKYLTAHPPTSLDLHFFPFLQGMLYAGNTGLLSDDEKDLVQSLADAFSTAYARYEDFNKLEAAKQQVDKTLTELKAAQTQLVQSEKMASLGELTAGIAHEIQNPLNFVNNFSEVNQEMIDELEEELKSGNIDEALAIAADIKQNEQKINHHGKRADGIVKGMLQHSRTGGGEKQPTNINSVADEYMRLSYHGLRAKDKNFNAEMVTHFDPDLPKINVIPQDIGRVLLNLFNNAFYAVNQKQKIADAGYKPEVSVTTSTENGQVVINVKDNGAGIPDAIKDKIMQPFFTTKPTGEGTGLGLSLTYDMVVKGHGGKIAVASKADEGSEFTISLPIN
jgi:signal transduction histidine kinase